MDGAHRVSIAAYYNLSIPIVRLPIDGTSMDVDFFRQRMTAEDDLDFLTRELCLWDKQLYLCCLWPAAKPNEKREEAIRLIDEYGSVVNRKSVGISQNGLHNLIPQIYLSKDWVGNAGDRFLSAAPKVAACSGNSSLNVILFHCNRDNSLNAIKELKTRMRAVFGIEEHSLHITDYREETKFAVDMLFNQNTIDFLNKGTPFRYVELNKRIFQFSRTINKTGRSLDNYIVDSSTIMGLYGIRCPDDLDYLTVEQMDIFEDDSRINLHHEELPYYKVELDDLIYNPDNYFFYMGVKFISLDVLDKFKRARGAKKDIEDIKLIEAYKNNKLGVKTICSRISLSAKRYARNYAFRILHRLPKGGYEKIRALYHTIKGKKGNR